jgi:Sec-independent protein translocase protein TatA
VVFTLTKEHQMIVLLIILILLFRSECGELIKAISQFIANCLKPDSQDQNQTYKSGK